MLCIIQLLIRQRIGLDTICNQNYQTHVNRNFEQASLKTNVQILQTHLKLWIRMDSELIMLQFVGWPGIALRAQRQ